MKNRPCAPRNRNLRLDSAERALMAERLVRLGAPATPDSLIGRTICQDILDAIPHLPSLFVDLLIIDPPYNLNKSFNGAAFKGRSVPEYAAWVASWLEPLRRVLKPRASIYVCCDWRC